MLFRSCKQIREEDRGPPPSAPPLLLSVIPGGFIKQLVRETEKESKEARLKKAAKASGKEEVSSHCNALQVARAGWGAACPTLASGQSILVLLAACGGGQPSPEQGYPSCQRSRGQRGEVPAERAAGRWAGGQGDANTHSTAPWDGCA